MFSPSTNKPTSAATRTTTASKTAPIPIPNKRKMVAPVAPSSLSSSPSSSSSSNGKRRSLGVADVANIFVKMRRTSAEAKADSAKSPNHIESSSGPAPQSHPGLLEAVTCAKRERLEHTDTFVCIGGVNVPLLLRATRTTIMETAEMVGANVLVDEQWKCTIRGAKNRSNGTFKVQIHYLASATRADRPDPHKPVALENAKGVPGLMTILKRED